MLLDGHRLQCYFPAVAIAGQHTAISMRVHLSVREQYFWCYFGDITVVSAHFNVSLRSEYPIRESAVRLMC
jgi:hypothetical protein